MRRVGQARPVLRGVGLGPGMRPLMYKRATLAMSLCEVWSIKHPLRGCFMLMQ